MGVRFGLVAVAVGMLVGTGMLSHWRVAECGASDGQKGPALDRPGLRLAAGTRLTKCEKVQLVVPPQLVETEGGPPLKVQDGEHLIGTAGLGGRQYQLKMVVSKGRSTGVILLSGGKRLQRRVGAPPPEVQECLKKLELGAQGPRGWHRWVTDWLAVPEAEARGPDWIFIVSVQLDTGEHYTGTVYCYRSKGSRVLCSVQEIYEDK